MATPIPMPRQGNTVETCVINQWLKKKGDTVKPGDILFTYETDKASFEFESPVAGIMLDTFFPEGQDIPVLTNVAAIGNKGENADEFRPSKGSTAPAPQAPASEQANALPASQPAALPALSQISGEIKVSPRAKMRAEEKGIALAGISGTGPEGRIIERDILSVAASKPVLTKTAQARASAEGLNAVAGGTGVGGRVRAQDLTAGAAKQRSMPLVDDVSEIKLTKIRSIIAQRMHQSLQQTAQLTMNASANASAIQSLRKKIKDNREAMGLENITLNDMIGFALSRVLPQFPDCNALFIDSTIRQYKHVHLAVAVDTPRGLMVPVTRFADALSLGDLARSIKSLAKQCNDGSINPDFLSGGTITMSNLGVFGVESFTPVLNLPQVALLGVSAISQKAVAGPDGQVRMEPYLGLSLTIDHRVVDGAPGARFLQALVYAIENFDLTLSRQDLT